MTRIDHFYEYTITPPKSYRISGTDINIESERAHLDTYMGEHIHGHTQLIETFTFYNPRAKCSHPFELRSFTNSFTYVVGYWGEVESNSKFASIFIEIYRMTLKPAPHIESTGLYTNVYEVEGVMAEEYFRKKGIATTIYKYLVNQLQYTLLGSDEQYFGARRLWARLSNEPDVIVDIIDNKKRKIVDKNVALYHGKQDHEYDNRLWSYGPDKVNLRSILKRKEG